MRIAFPAVLFVLVTSLSAGALELSLNGARRSSLPPARAAAISRTVSVSGAWLRGVPLEDVLPVMTEARVLTVSTASGSRRIEGAELAERLGEIVISVVDGDLSLVLPADLGPPVPGVLAIDVEGTPLDRHTLEVWVSWEGVRELKGLVAAYASAHDLDIKVVEVPDPRAKLMAVVRGGGVAADLVMVQSDYLPELVGIRALQPLGSLRTAELAATGWEAFRTRDGRQWAAPFFRDVQLVFTNPRLVPEPPPRWTLDDMERLTTPLAAKGLIPMAWNAYSAYWLVPFQAGFGKDELVEIDGSMVVDDPGTERAVTYLAGLERRGLLEAVERDAMIGLFGAGKVGLILSGSYSIPEFVRVGLPFRVTAFPRSPDGRPLSSLLDYKGFAVSRTSRNPLLARRLLQYLSRPEVQLEFATALDKLPASVAATAAFVAASPFGAALAESLESATLIPPEPVYGAFKNVMWSLLRLVFTGEMDVRAALGVAQRTVDKASKTMEGGTQ